MTHTNNILPDWISRQASLGPNVSIEGKMNDDNAFWYLLTMCCPQIFDSYAIILHPFWINWKAKDLIESDLKLTEQQIDKTEFERVSWSDFFKMYDKNFTIDTANQVQEEIRKGIIKQGWKNYIWYPAEGDCEKAELVFLRNQIKNVYGDQIASYYYCLLKTQKWESEIIYKGQLSELEQLWEKDDVRDSPTAIYTDTKDWCIVTDYDLQFTYVGGSKELIRSITKQTSFEIFELIPRFKETPAANKDIAASGA